MNSSKRLTPVIAITTGLLFCSTSGAFDMGNMMNPSKWMGGNKKHDDDYYDDYYDGPGYGYPGNYGGPGYGYGGAPGYGYGGAPGYGYGGAPGYGYGGTPGYGYGGTPGYGAPGDTAKQSEINQLRERLRILEGRAE